MTEYIRIGINVYEFPMPAIDLDPEHSGRGFETKTVPVVLVERFFRAFDDLNDAIAALEQFDSAAWRAECIEFGCQDPHPRMRS